MTAFAQWTSLEWVFLLCAMIGGASFIAWLLLQFIGASHSFDVQGDTDMHVDTDTELSGEADLSFTLLSFQGISAFLTMFGLVGLAVSRESGLGAVMAIALALAAGFGMSWLIGKLFSIFVNLQSSGTIDLNSTLGAEGTVYLRIPPQGQGKVNISVQGRMRVLEATQKGDQVLDSGSRVKVIQVIDSNLLVVQAIG
ncbi:MAG: hypothetical protein IPJ88_05710 [Myxococcales bacterium]|nr:MAG: hypothetical protein IPJ88_05710 [Myxococcales bacterium]